MRKVKVAAAFLCLFASGMIGGVTYDGNGMSVAHADQSGQIVEMTAETVTTTASIETTAIVTTATTASESRAARTEAETETSVTATETTGETEITATTTSETETASQTDATTAPAQTVAASTQATTKTTTITTRTVTTAAVTAAPVSTEMPKTEPQTETEPVYDNPEFAIEVTEREYIMLCNVVGHEYGSAWVPTEEKALIVECIMNRVASPQFPDTIYDVLMQPGQFTGIEYLIEMETLSDYYVTQSVKDAVDLYLTHPEQFQHGYLFFSGDGYRSYFRTSY